MHRSHTHTQRLTESTAAAPISSSTSEVPSEVPAETPSEISSDGAAQCSESGDVEVRWRAVTRPTPPYPAYATQVAAEVRSVLTQRE